MQLATGIDAARRHGIASGLSRVLADTHVLRLQTRETQRSVAGPMSSALRAMLGELHDELCAAEVELAARVRALGGAARAGSGEHARPSSARRGSATKSLVDAIGELLDAQDAAARTAARILALAEAAHDVPTSELLRRRTDDSEKNAWVLAFAGVGFLIARESAS